MSTSPFAVFDYSSFTFNTPWNDGGTGGHNWALARITNIPEGYGVLSDIVYWEHIAGGTGAINTKFALGKKILLCETKGDAVRKATKFAFIQNIDTRFKCSLWKPQCDDADYVAIGTAVGLGLNVQPATPYYLVHKRFLRDLGYTAGIALNEDRIMMYFTVGNAYHCFAVNDNHLYAIRDWRGIVNCCVGTGDSCENYAVGSVECKASADAYCAPEDVLPGGKCFDWSTRDHKSFDALKSKYCAANPTSKYCDCILAYDRDDYKAQLAANPYLAQFSKPACAYQRCKLTDNDILRTTDIYTAQEGDACAISLQYVDQQVKINGSGNVVDTANSATTQNISNAKDTSSGTSGVASTSTTEIVSSAQGPTGVQTAGSGNVVGASSNNNRWNVWGSPTNIIVIAVIIAVMLCGGIAYVVATAPDPDVQRHARHQRQASGVPAAEYV